MNIHSDFIEWWDNFGSGIVPLPDHDMEEHAKRIADIAFESGYLVCRNKDAEHDNP